MKQYIQIVAGFFMMTAVLSACEKWKDSPAKDLGLTNKYCNLPSAINYNVGFPGIPDNSVCILPTTPFVGRYSFRDSLYNLANELSIGDTFNFEIKAIDSTHFVLESFCSAAKQLRFVANKYYRAESDSVIGSGMQLLCRDLDTLSGKLSYKQIDSTVLIDFTVVSDTAVVYHRGTAYKK